MLSASPEAIAKRLCRLHDRIPPSTRTAGHAWYYRAADTMDDLSARHGIDVDTVARVAAVLSPQCPWARNVAGTELCLTLHAAGHPWEDAKSATVYGINVRKAWRILDGDPSALRGPKVEAFYANLALDVERVTVDVWATRAAIGRDIPGADHDAIIHGYRLAAKRLGYDPAILQAIIWVYVRGSAD